MNKTFNLKTNNRNKKLLSASMVWISGLNLCLFIYIKRLVSVFIYSLFKLSYYSTWLKKLFASFAKKSPLQYASYTRSFEILKHNFTYRLKFWFVILLQPHSNRFARFPLKIRSSLLRSAASCKTLEKWQVLRMLICPIPIPPGQDCFNNSPPLGSKGWTCPEVFPGGGW